MVNVIALEVWPLTIVPFTMLHEYEAPVCAVTLAFSVSPGSAVVGALMFTTGFGRTVTAVGAEVAAQPPVVTSTS